jgi:hypothetical protein
MRQLGAAALFLLAALAATADISWTPPYGMPSGKVMFGWPRADVHKKMGRPAASYLTAKNEKVEVTESFATDDAVEDEWVRKTPLNQWQVRVGYNLDPNTEHRGKRQRSDHVILIPEQPTPLWALLGDAPHELPEAVEICHGACELSRIVTGGENYALAYPLNPTEEQNMVGVLVHTGYEPFDTGQRWTAGLKFHFEPDSWTVDRIEILAVGHSDDVKPADGKKVEHIGLWRPR